eukprot:473306-Hanusia_phi.AAC.1
MDKYLVCVGTGAGSCSQYLPTLPYLERQNVDAGTVLTRCRSNYVNKVWDSGAAYLMNYLQYPGLSGAAYIISMYYNPSSMDSSVQNCLLESLRLGTGNDACLLGWLTLQNVSRTNYFQYEVASVDSATADFADIDEAKGFFATFNWSDPSLQESFFSVEGDVIHQMFDCYFLGPFASAELSRSHGCIQGPGDDALLPQQPDGPDVHGPVGGLRARGRRLLPEP